MSDGGVAFRGEACPVNGPPCSRRRQGCRGAGDSSEPITYAQEGVREGDIESVTHTHSAFADHLVSPSLFPSIHAPSTYIAYLWLGRRSEGGKNGGNAHTPQLRTIDTRPPAPSLAHNVSLSNSSGGTQQGALTLSRLEMQLIPSHLGQMRPTCDTSPSFSFCHVFSSKRPRNPYVFVWHCMLVQNGLASE